ncbi:MAG: hypothetical protein ACO3JG_01625 [Luteolibacter sp.]
MTTLIEITGGLLIALALLHAAFPRRFRWREETAGLSLLTRQILYVHTFFIALTVFMIGLLCVTSADDLMHTALGRRIGMGLAAFWGIRLAIQFVGYSPALWRGKVFETTMHVLFSLFWAFLTLLFLRISLG